MYLLQMIWRSHLSLFVDLWTGVLLCQCCCSGFKEILPKGDQWGSSKGCKCLIFVLLNWLFSRVAIYRDIYSPLLLSQAAALKGSDHRRATNVGARLDAQQKKLNLPVLPTTTIGSFPQTIELRRVRREYKAKKWVNMISFSFYVISWSSVNDFMYWCPDPVIFLRISEEEYVNAIRKEINKVVKLQEELDIDVLVHGEPEVSFPMIVGESP